MLTPGPSHIQTQSTECGLASMGIILAHFGRFTSLETLREVSGVSRDCVSASDLLRIASHFGLEASVKRREPEELATMGLPLVVFLDFIHFTVVEGIDEEGVALNDPGLGRYRMPRETFADSFTGIALAFRPGPDFRPGGSTTQLWRRIRRQAAFCPQKATVLACICAAAAPLPVLAWLLAIGTGAVTPAGSEGVSLAVGTLLASGGLLVTATLVAARLEGAYRTARLVDLTRHILAQPFAFFVYRVAPVLTGRVLSHVHLARAILHALPASALGVFLLPVILAGLAVLHGTIAALATLVTVAALCCMALLADKAGRLGLSRQDERDAQWLKLSHSLANFESFKTSAGDDEAFIDLMGFAADRLEVRQGIASHRILADLVPDVTLLVLLCLALASLALQPINPVTGPWPTIMALCLVVALRAPLRAFASLHGRIEQLQLTLPALDDLLDSRPAVDASLGALPINGTERVLCLTQASFGFSHAKPAVLKDISFSLDTGEWLAITGRSGGGKSTLVGLAIGLHRPWSGSVTFCGHAMEQIGRAALSRRIGWVSKHGFFVPGTLRDNIRLWDSAVTEADIARAVADTCLSDVLDGVPGGLDGAIGWRAESLSGGQRQRLEIARALARNPHLLVLDEATDGLDADTEALVFQALRRRGIAVLVVSHRASTIAACDRVLHLRDGRLGSGTASEYTPPSGPRSASGVTDPLTALPPPMESLDGCVGPHGALFAVFDHVARASGLPPPKAPARSERLPPETPAAGALRMLARHNKVAARAIRFSVMAWRRLDHGPLIGFHREDGRPLSILTDGRGGLCILDPTATRLAQDGGPTIGLEDVSPVAYCLYPANPEGKHRPSALVSRTMRPARADLRWLIAGSMALPLLGALTPGLAMLGLCPTTPLNGPALALWLGALALVVASALVAATVLGVVQARVEGILELTANARLYRHVMRLRPLSVVALAPDRIHRALLAVPALLALPRGGLARNLCGLSGIVACLLLLVWHAPDLAMLAVGLLSVLPALVAIVMARRRAPAMEWMERHAESREVLAHLMRAAGKLHQTARDQQALAVWRNHVGAEGRPADTLLRLDAILDAALLWYPWAAVVLFLIALASTLGGNPGFGNTMALALAFTIASMLAADFSQAMAVVARTGPALARLKTLLEAPTDPAPQPIDPSCRNIGAPPLLMEHVSHAYPNRPHQVLRDVSLRVEAGEIVALTGPTGCGKTTLLRLALGFMPPDSGTILRDGMTEAAGNTSAWRDHVGAVLQDDQLETAMTIRGHIGGRNGFTLAEIREAARRAQLEADIDAMPMGIQSIVDSERISTGQKQRILIARRLVRKPRLLILDEATNALSDPMQADLFTELRALRLAVLVVTHRTSALALADRVYRMEAGRIISCIDAATFASEAN